MCLRLNLKNHVLNKKEHWETVYGTKTPEEVSWTQEVPQISLELIHSLSLKKNSKIIDVGGGNSKLVDFLLDEGFEDITVLDISGKALERAKKRLGEHANKVTWIETDIISFQPKENYDLWHDRAAFHFLTEPEQIQSYLDLVNESVQGHLIIGTFSENGPEKCSGLSIKQYSPEQMEATFQKFEKMGCQTENHQTPFGTTQHFLFCSFKRRA